MRRALIVGINDYPAAPLKGCINDASSFEAILKTNGDGSGNFGIKTVTDIKKMADLKGLLIKLFEGKCDIALFYFSGHGYINDLGGYIVTPDAIANNEGVSMDDILTLANHSEAKYKIIILDCCHAGAMGTPKVTGGTKANLEEGVIILTSCKKNEKAIESEGHGIFTRLLLEALHGGAADLKGDITPGSVYAYIDQALGPWYQRPVFKANIAGFMSLRSVSPQVEPQVLHKLTTYFEKPDDRFILSPAYEPTCVDAEPDKTAVFRHLQKLQSVGLVIPAEEEHMYWAAMHSASCRLTPLGQHYWRLVKNNRI